MKRKTWKPRGHGYEELAERWGIPNPWMLKRIPKNADTILQQRISLFMLESRSDNTTEVALDLRTFLLKLAENDHGYDAPLWIGLAAITEDTCLLKHASKLVGDMWT